MKLSYTTLSVQDRTIGEAVEIASAHGLEGIELRGRGDAHVSPESTFSYAAQGAAGRKKQNRINLSNT